MIRGIISPTNGRDGARDFGQVGRHRLGVDGGQDQACGHAAGRADRAKQIGPLIACVARRTGSGAAPGPDAGQGSLLADPGFILEPDLDGFALRSLRDRRRYRRTAVFLKASWASGSVFGCCGRDLQPAIPQCRQTDSNLLFFRVSGDKTGVHFCLTRSRCRPCARAPRPRRSRQSGVPDRSAASAPPRRARGPARPRPKAASSAICAGARRGTRAPFQRFERPARPSAL